MIHSHGTIPEVRRPQINVTHAITSMEHDASTPVCGQCLKVQQKRIMGCPYPRLNTIPEPESQKWGILELRHYNTQQADNSYTVTTA
jgi:hypothetical protein